MNRKLILLTITLLFASMSNSFAQGNLVITQEVGLSFGKILMGSTIATVTVPANPTGTPIAISGAIQTTTGNSARIKITHNNVTGTGNKLYLKSVVVQEQALLTMNGNTSQKLEITNINHNWNNVIKEFKRGDNTFLILNIGGTLHITNTNLSGIYNGTFSVTITYD